MATTTMSSFSAVMGEKQLTLIAPTSDASSVEEIARLNKELEFLKNANPYRIAELNLELQIEKMRVVEMTKARDIAVERLADAYTVIRQKNEFIDLLQRERENKGAKPLTIELSRSRDLEDIERLKSTVAQLHSTINDLRSVMRDMPPSTSVKPVDPPPCYEENAQRAAAEGSVVPAMAGASPKAEAATAPVLPVEQGGVYTPPATDDPKELVDARHAVLAEIPLPANCPDATLSAIVIPPPFTLREFLSGAPAPLKSALSSYRILQNITTSWCPDREEHGYMYTPMFKCSTNPRIATAHRWSAVDVHGRMSKPTECFYHKDGLWYYAGSYKAFKLDALSTKEWAGLGQDTISALVKETIADRKNSSPQTTYETTQQYAAGALKVACVGLQCVGFNQDLYKAIIQYSIKFGETKWKAAQVAAASSSGSGTPSTTPVSSAGPTTPGTPPVVLPSAMVAPTTVAGASGSKVVPTRHIATGHRAPSHVQPFGLSPQPATPAPTASGASISHGGVASSIGLGSGKSPLVSQKPTVIPPLNLGASSASIWSTSTGHNSGPGADLTAPTNKLANEATTLTC
ncbi:hypothetical protein D9619_012172 [Psilocybe cf. subviscida]|uniref:DUF6697 domain-containing protein n=1 Tax=Psilocybe cf. subviscida TaxID=2480587 RepID=A0A8H5B987_9AGAR|nr:hypothetical protein D9619_012172 [Psilocybe cf. subviscida]